MSLLFIEQYESQTVLACEIASRVEEFTKTILEDYSECSTIEIGHIIVQTVTNTCAEIRMMRAQKIRHAIRIANSTSKEPKAKW